ncbi:sensor histidine kinase [Nakamurella lactea]|uniref:sensor histidine kinase n=1 Tax=Nakamurella lactea TaxID=459515 RepID=UPI00055A1E63|nr:histidine kinase [Nakamurella lactea]
MDRAAIVRRAQAAVVALRRRTDDLPRLSRWAWAADVSIAVVLAAATYYSAVNPTTPSEDGPLPIGLPGVWPGVPTPPITPDLWARDHAPIAVLVLAAVCTLPLALRRRYPLAGFWSVLVLTVLFHAEYDTGVSPDATAMFTFTACLLAGYSAVRYSPFRNAALASIAAGTLLILSLYETNVPEIAPGYVPFFVLLVVALAANAIHGWKQRLRAAQAQTLASTTRAVERERSRIARDLHDVVTHHVNVMLIQAGAARTVMNAEPEQARQLLLSVEAGGREAMAELRDVMGLLRSSNDEDDADLVPQPGLEQLDALAERMRSAGVPVELSVVGEPVALPAGADLAAYRVVQEALTNIVKHADGARARVTVEYRDRQVRVQVADSGGNRSATADDGGGRGLIGLRERLAVYSGILSVGPVSGGGFQVCAEIPTGVT